MISIGQRMRKEVLESLTLARNIKCKRDSKKAADDLPKVVVQMEQGLVYIAEIRI